MATHTAQVNTSNNFISLFHVLVLLYTSNICNRFPIFASEIGRLSFVARKNSTPLSLRYKFGFSFVFQNVPAFDKCRFFYTVHDCALSEIHCMGAVF